MTWQTNIFSRLKGTFAGSKSEGNTFKKSNKRNLFSNVYEIFHGTCSGQIKTVRNILIHTPTIFHSENFIHSKKMERFN